MTSPLVSPRAVSHAGAYPVFPTALKQCDGDWTFVVELLGDLLADEKKNYQQLEAAVSANNHKVSLAALLRGLTRSFAAPRVSQLYGETAHGIKGAALNMHMPALAHESKLAEFLGKELTKSPDVGSRFACLRA